VAAHRKVTGCKHGESAGEVRYGCAITRVVKRTSITGLNDEEEGKRPMKERMKESKSIKMSDNYSCVGFTPQTCTIWPD
jgi:hypothetical protein